MNCKILPSGKEQPSVKLFPHIWRVLKSRMQLALSLLGICHNGFVLSHPSKLSHSPERSVPWFRYFYRLIRQMMRLAIFQLSMNGKKMVLIILLTSSLQIFQKSAFWFSISFLHLFGKYQVRISSEPQAVLTEYLTHFGFASPCIFIHSNKLIPTRCSN